MGERTGWEHQTPIELGIPEIIRPANPALGAEWTQTVPANTVWLILLVRFRLVTSVTAAQRQPSIAINDGSGLVEVGQPGSLQTASLTRDYSYQENAPFTIVGGEIMGSFPSRVYLLPGWIIQSTTANIQVDDQFSAIQIYLHRWLVSS